MPSCYKTSMRVPAVIFSALLAIACTPNTDFQRLRVTEKSTATTEQIEQMARAPAVKDYSNPLYRGTGRLLVTDYFRLDDTSRRLFLSGVLETMAQSGFQCSFPFDAAVMDDMLMRGVETGSVPSGVYLVPMVAKEAHARGCKFDGVMLDTFKELWGPTSSSQ